MNYLKRITYVFLDYSKLFQAVKQEKLMPSLLFYAFLSVITLLVSWIFLSFNQVPANLSILKEIPITARIFWYVPLLYFVFTLLAVFFFGALSTLFSRLLTVQTTVSTNMKIFAHASVPFMLTLWIPAFNLITTLWSVYLNSRGMSELYHIDFKTAFLVVVGAGIATTFMVTIFTISGMTAFFGIDFDLERIFLTRT